jgi:O-antigen ligase
VWLMLLIAGAALGMLGSMFTGSRGSWAALPVCLIILYRCFGGSFSRRFVFGGLGALALAVVVMFAIPRTEVRERTELAFTEAYSYLKTRNADSSIGTRMEMWRTGYLAASERPLLGWGKAGFVERETEMIKAKMVSPIMQDNNHVYNEWLDAIVKRGLPGLLVLLALYIVPLVLFRRYLRQGNAASMPYALAGTLLIVNYIGFGFSQVFLAHNTGVMTLVFMLVIIWSLLRAAAPLQSLRQ